MATNFTEAEWLILSSLGYCDSFANKFDKNGNPMLGTGVDLDYDGLWKELEKKVYEGSEKGVSPEYDAAFQSVKKKLKDGNYKVVRSINNNGVDESGFAAFAIAPEPNENNEVIVCCRGSDSISSENLNDWIAADFATILPVQTQQEREMKMFMDSLQNYNSISLVGHSLGGHLAMHGAVVCEDKSKIKEVHSFDGNGFSDEYVIKNYVAIKEVEDKINNYQCETDIVSSLLNGIGKIKIIDAVDEKFGVKRGHSRWNFQVNEDGSFKTSYIKNIVCTTVGSLSKDPAIEMFVTDIVLIYVSYKMTMDIVNKLKDMIWSRFTQGYINCNLQVRINTQLMETYASKLEKIQKKVNNLDKSMNSLYLQVGLQDLGKIIRGNIIMGFSFHMSQSIKWLKETSDDFIDVEKELTSKI